MVEFCEFLGKSLVVFLILLCALIWGPIVSAAPLTTPQNNAVHSSPKQDPNDPLEPCALATVEKNSVINEPDSLVQETIRVTTVLGRSCRIKIIFGVSGNITNGGITGADIAQYDCVPLGQLATECTRRAALNGSEEIGVSVSDKDVAPEDYGVGVVNWRFDDDHQSGTIVVPVYPQNFPWQIKLPFITR